MAICISHCLICTPRQHRAHKQLVSMQTIWNLIDLHSAKTIRFSRNLQLFHDLTIESIRNIYQAFTDCVCFQSTMADGVWFDKFERSIGKVIVFFKVNRGRFVRVTLECVSIQCI